MDDTDRQGKKRLAILGSTGSIGTQALDIVRLFPNRLCVDVLTAGNNVDILIAQAREHRPQCVVVAHPADASRVVDGLAGLPIQVLSGPDGLVEAARWPTTDIVVTALVGAVGLVPTLEAVKRGKRIALANKETLVVAGSIVTAQAALHNTEIIPVDSEHSAIFQCLEGEPADTVEALILTASGGPFRSRPLDTFSSITRDDALRHPTWKMGPKITVDSATMMNKGLEVLEARWLFDLDADHIQVVVHPQSVIHSMVTFVDGSTKAQLGVPDMKVPIQYALSYPERWSAGHARVDWDQALDLTFESPDFQRFPCLQLAFDALRTGGAAPAVLNAANEEAVDLFLRERVRYTDIPMLIERVLSELQDEDGVTIDDLLHADQLARRRVQELAGTGDH